MDNEIKVIMDDIKMISELVVKQQVEWEEHPSHNEYMRLQFNVGVLKDKLTELQEYMKFK
jgi:hypothetical protein